MVTVSGFMLSGLAAACGLTVSLYGAHRRLRGQQRTVLRSGLDDALESYGTASGSTLELALAIENIVDSTALRIVGVATRKGLDRDTLVKGILAGRSFSAVRKALELIFEDNDAADFGEVDVGGIAELDAAETDKVASLGYYAFEKLGREGFIMRFAT